MKRGRPPYDDILTPREWQVLDLLSDGLTNDEIANRLGISVHGAKYHVAEILSKLGVNSREEAVQSVKKKDRTLAGLPFASSLFKRTALTGKSSSTFLLGSVFAAAMVVFAFFLLGLLGIRGSGPSAIDDTKVSGVGLDVSPGRGTDAAAFTALAEQVSERVASNFPDAVLKQIDVQGGGSWMRFGFAVTATDCEDPTNLAANVGHQDKCALTVEVPGISAPAGQWKMSRPFFAPLSYNTASAIDLNSVQVGPALVGQLATAHWPGCTPSTLTLSADPEPPTWHVFCAQADGGTFRGTADPRTGAFQPQAGPVYPPPVATHSP